jgi:hypothetical protein
MAIVVIHLRGALVTMLKQPYEGIVTMSDNHEESDLKGLGISFLLISFLMLGTPLLVLAAYG